MSDLLDALRMFVVTLSAAYLYRRPGFWRPVGFVLLVGVAAYFATVGVLMGLYR